MALFKNNTIQALGAWLLAFSQVFWVVGCRQTTGGGSGGASQTAPGATAGLNIGELVYQIMHHGYESKGEQAKADTLELNHDEFVGAINQILPSSVGQNLFPTLVDLLPLVDDGTVEAALTDVEAIVQDLVNDPATLDAIAELMSSKPGGERASFADQRDTFVLLNRLLAYPELDRLSSALFKLLEQYDGVDENGNSNGERNLFAEVQGLLSRTLQNANVQQGSSAQISQGLGDLADALLAEYPMKGFGDLGAPAWSVRLDVHKNPAVVVDPASGMLPAPFVDADADGAADVNANGTPVDASGVEIEIPAFGNEGSRDSYGRALAPGGALYYDYFDAKHTLLSELLLVAGELLKKDLGARSVLILDSLAGRVPNDNGTPSDPTDDYETLSPDSPILDLTYAQFELVKHTRTGDLLKGIAEIVKNDPDKFGEIVDTLIVAIKQAGNAAAATPPSTSASTGKQLLDDLLPLLQDTLRPNGQSTSTMRDLLSAFNSQQAQLQTLPASFARMMKYHDYNNRVLADATKKSVMQRLLEMMERADKCNAPFAGNMADFYLRAMAGDQRLLGINISINTIERLLNVGILRRLLCSGIRADDVLALKDFNQSGALDAMKPIAKVFSNRNQIPLLKNIMLGLGKHYEGVMRPTEPTTVALLESGAVELLFEVIDDMTRVQVPGQNDVVADVLADVLSEIMVTSSPVFNRRGQQLPSLMHLLMEPLDALAARAQATGADQLLDQVMSGLGEVLFATYVDDMGTTDPADDVERWRYDCLKAELGNALAYVADHMPSTPADRARWAAESQRDIENLLSGREVVMAIDLLKAISSSPEKQVINDALANLFTPQPNASEDVFGALCVLAAGLINHKKQAAPSSPVSDAALQQVLHFVGLQLDPALNRFSGIGRLALRLLAADDGLLLLKIIRNAIDMGPNGTEEPPIAILQRILGDVGAAGGGGPTTGEALQTQLQGFLDFMRDDVEGLPAFIQRIKNRTAYKQAA